MNVSRATLEDWPFIERLRARYFAGWSQPVQRRPDETVWKVAIDAHGVAGCYSYVDAVDYGQRWALDFYVVDGPRGKRAAALMWRDLRASAAAEGFSGIGAQVHPANLSQLRSMDRQGFRPVALTMMLTIKEA